MDPITEGAAIEVADALGRTFVKRALSSVETTGSYAAVWACSEDEWRVAHAEGREPAPEPFPWPLDAIKVLSLS